MSTKAEVDTNGWQVRLVSWYLALMRRPALYLDPACFDRPMCDRVRAAMNAGRSEAAEVLQADITLNLEARRASSIEVDASTLAFVERHLDEQRGRLDAFFGIALEGREGAGFLRYGPGGFYRAHRDRAESTAWPAAARRRVAAVVFLNDDFDGGALRLIAPDPQVIAPRQGLLAAFPATVLHEVLPILSGTRDVIVDWFY